MSMLRAILLLFMLVCTVTASAAQPRIGVVTIRGPINPVVADHLRRSVDEAQRNGEHLLLVEMDTPGGLDTAMREIVKSLFGSRVPVVVHVAPSGARAASAGAVIALAADVCAMAPGTNIGAAHPVSMGGKPDPVMEAKIVNDAEAYIEGIAVKRGRNPELAKRMVRESISISAEKGLEGKVVDLLAADRTDLLAKLDGWRLQRSGETITIRTAGASLVSHEMTTREKILDVISNPNVAYILMMLGILGLFFELSTPGVIVPGVIGAICLILSSYALQTLPVNFAGVLLILLALILFFAETQIVSHGVLAIGGIVALLFGSLLLFPSPEPALRISRGVLFSTVAVTGGLFVFIVSRSIQVHRRRPTTGNEGLIGEWGVADTDLAPEGKVAVHGEYWDAWSEQPVSRGERVQVVDVKGLRLKVRGEEKG